MLFSLKEINSNVALKIKIIKHIKKQVVKYNEN